MLNSRRRKKQFLKAFLGILVLLMSFGPHAWNDINFRLI